MASVIVLIYEIIFAFVFLHSQFLKSLQKIVLEKLDLRPNKSSVALRQSLRPQTTVAKVCLAFSLSTYFKKLRLL